MSEQTNDQKIHYKITILENDMKKTILIAIIVVATCIAGALFFIIPSTAPRQALTTYFSYTKSDLDSLAGLSSKQRITTDDIFAWDSKAFTAVIQAKTSDVVASKFYTYLAIGQREFDHLSYNHTGVHSGNIAVVSKQVFCQFYPADCGLIFITGDTDAYSEKLANIVVEKMNNRILEDDRNTKLYPAKIGPEYWNGPEPMLGREVGSWKPWFIKSSDQFRVPESLSFGSAAFDEQLKITQNALKNVTPEQRKAVIFWAGGPGTKTPPGIWLDIADQYMKGKQVTVQDLLTIRASLTAAMADAFIGCFDSKYTYWVRRPFMVDESIQTVMPTPNHPSYPAGHACVSAAADVVLAHYFPEDRDTWNQKSHEAADSRLWGGIHYTRDNQEGFTLGTSVAQLVLQQVQ